MANDIILSFNPRRNELFITKESSLTYVLSDRGLGAVSAKISDIVYNQGEFIVHSPAGISQADINIKTDILTLGSLGSKRILGVEAEVMSPDDVFISIDYRTSRSAAFITTPEVELDKDKGWAKFDISGVEFRINFRVDNYTSMRLENAIVRYSYLDRLKRGI